MKFKVGDVVELYDEDNVGIGVLERKRMVGQIFTISQVTKYFYFLVENAYYWQGNSFRLADDGDVPFKG